MVCFRKLSKKHHKIIKKALGGLAERFQKSNVVGMSHRNHENIIDNHQTIVELASGRLAGKFRECSRTDFRDVSESKESSKDRALRVGLSWA